MVQKIKANIIKKTDLSTEQKLPYIVKICEKISKASIYLLVFLLPVFFLPWTVDVLDFNKQALLIALVFIALFVWLLKVLIAGKVSFSFGWIHVPVIVLFLVFLASTIFSLYPYASFWGWPQVISEGFVSLFFLVLFYFLVTNIFEKKEIFYLFVLLIVSSGLAMLYGILQLLGKFLLPFDFTKSPGFNTIGTANGLAVFTAVLLPLIIFLLVFSRKIYLKIFFIIVAFLSVVLLILVNFQIAWWLVIAGSVLIITLGAQKRELFGNRWLILPMFFLVIALFFSLFRFQIAGLPSRPIEASLTNKISFDIALQALKEGPILGSGPGTFVYNFSKYKDISFNRNPFWNIRFEGANSKFLTLLGTNGILGILSFLGLIALFFFYGIRAIFKEPKNKTKSDLAQLSFGVFISFIILSLSFFIYQSNLSFGLVFFLLMAGLVSLLSSAKKEFILKPSSLPTLGITFGFILIFIFGIGIIFLEGQKYISELNYLKGVKAWQQGNIEETIGYLERAVDKNPKNDLYWRELSQVYLRQIDRTAKKTDLSREEITRQVQSFIDAAINSAKTATNLNPENVANFSVQGFIYQSLIGIVGGTTEWAIKSYEQALLLEPTNPYFPTQLGLIYYQNNDYQKAQAELERAVLLDQNYANALYFLGLTYDQLGDKDKAIEKFKKVSDLNPDNVEVKKILENLKAGEKALTGITEEVPPEVPIKEEHPEIEK